MRLISLNMYLIVVAIRASYSLFWNCTSLLDGDDANIRSP